MPAERRSLRSNKPEDSDKQKPNTNSLTSNSKKDKISVTRSTSSRSKPVPKKGATSLAGEMSGDKPHLNGRDTAEGNAKESEDVEMEEGTTSPGQGKGIKRKDGEEEMTVVVPPTKSSKTPGVPQKDTQGDFAMNGDTEADDGAANEAEVDPRDKAITS